MNQEYFTPLRVDYLPYYRLYVSCDTQEPLRPNSSENWHGQAVAETFISPVHRDYQRDLIAFLYNNARTLNERDRFVVYTADKKNHILYFKVGGGAMAYPRPDVEILFQTGALFDMDKTCAIKDPEIAEIISVFVRESLQ